MTPTSTPTNTPTNTPTATPTSTPTNTPTTTPTNLPIPPAISGGASPGDSSVSGDGSPNCNKIQICKVGVVGGTPSMPPCTLPDTMLGMGPTNGAGIFNIPIAPPLAEGECIYAFDTCTNLVSAVECAFAPAPAPVVSRRTLPLAVALLGLVALVGLLRLRRNPV